MYKAEDKDEELNSGTVTPSRRAIRKQESTDPMFSPDLADLYTKDKVKYRTVKSNHEPHEPFYTSTTSCVGLSKFYSSYFNPVGSKVISRN